MFLIFQVFLIIDHNILTGPSKIRHSLTEVGKMELVHNLKDNTNAFPNYEYQHQKYVAGINSGNFIRQNHVKTIVGVAIFGRN